ncbi:MAG: hypothetical protein R8G01_07130 [Ilumatobacteraceae bacterium]|nr:hypothetical protein [Ilumatobacteraceae bacterium]
MGAAVAITLGAGGIGLVSATNPGDAVAFVPITPCRVMDTRTEFNVGPKTSPVGPGEVYTVNTTTGNTGDCSGIPTTATGVSLNVTALDATLPTFLTVWATGEPQPDASSLNPVPGAPPTPNAVTTGISAGQFDLYNLQGNVQVIADINGYYTDHDHDDRYYTKNQVDQISIRPFAVESDPSTIRVEAGLFDDPDLANTLTVTAPGPGQLLVTVSGNYSAIMSGGLHPDVECSLSDDGVFDASYRSQYEVWNDDGATGSDRSETDLSIVRVVEVDAAGDLTFELLCRERSSANVLVVSRIIAQYFP